LSATTRILCLAGLSLSFAGGAQAQTQGASYFEGDVLREVHLEGGLGAPTVVTTLRGEAVSVLGLPPTKVQAELRLPLGGRGVTFRLTAEGGPVTHLEARGTLPLATQSSGADPTAPTLDWNAPGELHLTAVGLDTGVLGRWFPALPLAGRGDLTLDLSGAAGAPTGHVVLASAAGTLGKAAKADDPDAKDDKTSLRWRGAIVGPARVDLGLAGSRTTLDARLGPDAAPYLTLTADVPVNLDPRTLAFGWREGEPHQVTLTGRGLTPARLRPFWRAPAAADFTVDLDASAAGPLDRFFADVVARGTLRDGARPPLRVTATGRLEPKRQAFTLRLGRDALEAGVEARALLPEIVRGGAVPATAPLKGHLVAAVPLDTLAPYLPEVLYAPKGRVDADLVLAGTLGTPDVRGKVVLDRVATSIESLMLRLSEIQATVVVEGETARIEAFSAQAGAGGRLTGSAQAQWHTTPAGATPTRDVWADWTLEATGALNAEAVPFVQPEVPIGLLTGRMNTRWTAGPGRLDTLFEIADTRLMTSRESLPPARAIPRNPGVRNRDWLARVRPPDSFLAGEGHLGLTVKLLTPVSISGEDTALRLTGEMVMNRDAEQVRVDGGFDVLDGHFVLFENPFTLRQGRFTLQAGDLSSREAVDARAGGAGEANLIDPEKAPQAVPLEPVLSLLANGYVVDTDVTVGVRGPARQPQLVLRSNPPLAEYQILTLLVTGRANALDDSNGDVRREAAQLVDRFHNPSLERQLYDRIGVDKLGLGFGDAVDQPILTVGRQITRELYLETVYHHNAPPTDNLRELRVEYQLTPRFSLDTAYGDAAIGNVDVAWKGRFGGVPPAKPRSSLLAEDLAPTPAPAGAPPTVSP
jgi:hypothetical protein